jgi:hypothetical protein
VIITVHDAAGRMVRSQQAMHDGVQWFTDVHAAPGLYAIRAVQGKHQCMGRVIVP